MESLETFVCLTFADLRVEENLFNTLNAAITTV